MESLAGRLTGQARTDAEEQAGRLYRRSKEYSRALPMLRAAARDAPSTLQRDRVRWFVLDILFAIDERGLPRQVADEAAGWSDPSYFSDLLHGRVAELVSGREWKTLAGLWRALDTTGPDDVRAQLSYVLARQMQEGTIRQLTAAPGVTPRALFQDAERRDPAGYYGILAASILGDLPDKAVPASAADTTADSAVNAPGLDPIALGFLPYGLTTQAWSRLWAARESLNEPQVLEAARRLAEEQGYTKPAASDEEGGGEPDEITNKRLDTVFGKSEKQ
jgi:hypothetical protein